MRQLYAYDFTTNREFPYVESDDNEPISNESLSHEEIFRREVGVFSCFSFEKQLSVVELNALYFSSTKAREHDPI